MTRCFIGFSIQSGDQKRLNKAVTRLKECTKIDDYRWTAPTNRHLTLLFLGEVNNQAIEKIQHGLNMSIQEQPAIPLNFTHIESFPDARSPIIAATAQPTILLSKLVSRLHASISDKLDHKLQQPLAPLRPHITLARCPRGKQANIAPLVINIPMQLKTITLYSSQLSPEGSHYKSLFEAELKA